VGGVLVAWINFWTTYAEYVVHASRMNISHYPVALFVSYFILAVSVPLLRRFGDRLALSSADLAVVLAMGFVGAMVPTSGLMGFLLGIIATPFYFANAENRWGEYFHPHIPDWVAPRDTGKALTYFFDGPPGEIPIPWEVWLVPMAWWLVLTAAVVYASLAIAVILRKPWSEHERLVYPLVAASEELIRLGSGGDTSTRRPTFWRERLFWVGMAMPLSVMVWNFATFFSPLIPYINYAGRWMTPLRGFPRLRTRINSFTLGFAYLANLEVLLSLWVFYLIVGTEVYAFNRLGFKITGTEDSWSQPHAASGWQSFGGLTVFVLWGLFVAREHLSRVFRAALGRREADDSDEILSYQAAVWGLLVSVILIFFWLLAAGMSVPMIVLIVFGTFIVFVGIGRIVSEAGLVYVRAPLTPQVFSIYALGPGNLSPASMTMSAFTYVFFSQGKGLFATPLIHAARLGEFVSGRRRRMALAVVAAIAIGILVCTVVTFSWGYERGAYNFNDYPFSSGSKHAFTVTIKKMQDTRTVDIERLLFYGIGAVVMGLLVFLRYRFPRWPLHPVGFTIPLTYATLNSVFAVFLAWMLKFIVMRIGGATLYNRTRPLCFGLIVGYALGVGLSFLGDYVWFFGDGHGVHSW